MAPEDALAHVFGYTVANDVSARDLQFGDGQWVRGKSLDTFCPLGPVLVTADEIADPQALHLTCSVNGEVMQDATTDQMVFCVAELMSHCSHSFTLEPGDVLLTGTPWGCGEFMDPKRSLAPGTLWSARSTASGSCAIRSRPARRRTNDHGTIRRTTGLRCRRGHLARRGRVLIAGGTQVMPRVMTTSTGIERLVSLRRAGMAGIELANGRAVVGAATTLTQLGREEGLAFLHPVVESIASRPSATSRPSAATCSSSSPTATWPSHCSRWTPSLTSRVQSSPERAARRKC